VIHNLLVTDEHLVAIDMLGGPMGMRLLDRTGKVLGEITMPEISSVSGTVHLKGSEAMFRIESFTKPAAWFRFDAAASPELKPTGFAVSSPAKYENVEVTRHFARSKDGTRVPMTIIAPAGLKRNGQTPTVLYGYGGYGINMNPRFNARRQLWVEQGGIYVIANIRGGGEFGDEWHRTGNLTKKQNVFDDFAACALELINAGYTNPRKLAIEGGSNGGLLVGATMAQHPQLFEAVVCHVGVLDMLRVELHPNGAFNVTEFGTVTVPEQFKALFGYSPYHNVKPKTAYPAVFFLTGEHDGRVDPYHSRKMAAKLQASSTSGEPVLLKIGKAGHGIGTALSQRIADETDVWTFLFDELKLPFKKGNTR
jgi:prolyl oligopeptidase